MKRRVQLLVGMSIILVFFFSGCIANQPNELSVQSTVDAAVATKEFEMETRAAVEREILLTQVAGELNAQLQALRSELQAKDDDDSSAQSGVLAPTVSFLVATPTLSIGSGSSSASTSAAIPTMGLTAAPQGSCTNRFTFLSDVTFPDGTMTMPRTRFTKTWYIQNSGTCTMNRQYKVVFVSGSLVSDGKEFPLFSSERILKPGESAPISIPLVAPEEKGKYTTSWGIKSPDGTVYGAGPDGVVWLTSVFQVGNQYNFYENLNGAICSDTNGLFFCGSSDRSGGRGAVYYNSSPTMESNYAGGQSILVAPPMVDDGVTRVAFGPLRVARGTWLRSAISCPPNAPLCDNNVTLYVQPSSGVEQFVAQNHEVNDGFASEWNVNLSDFGYHDQDITIIFEVKANGGVSSDDLIIFMNPRLTDIAPR